MFYKKYKFFNIKEYKKNNIYYCFLNLSNLSFFFLLFQYFSSGSCYVRQFLGGLQDFLFFKDSTLQYYKKKWGSNNSS